MVRDFSLDTSLFPDELALLLDLMRNDRDNTGNAEAAAAADGFDWDRFYSLVRHHRLYPALYGKLHTMAEDGTVKAAIPRQWIQALRSDYQSNTFQMLKLSAEMEQLSKLFAESGIKSLVLKGPVLAADLYGDISKRTCGDLDVLVPIDRLEQAEKLLEEMGYVKDDYIETVLNDWKWRHHHITFFHLRKGMKIEVHWRLNPGPGKEPDFHALWERKRLSAITHHPVYYLGREDLFLFLVSHGARHGWSRLRWLTDIDRIARQEMDWARLLRLLDAYGYVHVGAQALILASQLLHTPVPPELKSITEDRHARRLAQDALYYIRQMINLHGETIPEDVAKYHKRHLFTLMSLQQKVLFILSFFHPYPEDAKTLALPKRLHVLYFPLRPFLWLWRKTKKQPLSQGGT
ncbi:nucleotidyltransferase family protein [Paenibacillus sp. NPDC056579]|uniref:nucleotidyltransferase domain-containing protein n=1 Tax=Paenibacillus sp. NPDC056579 TaxID=3345871 RepID=UPI00369DA2AE